MRSRRLVLFAYGVIFVCVTGATVAGEEPRNLEERLKEVDVSRLAREARLRGNPERGAVVFFTSAAGCVKCHQAGDGAFPLGPDLAKLGPGVTDEHLVESLLHPSKSIRKGYETLSLITADGRVFSGMRVRETDDEVVLRDASNLEQEVTVRTADVDERLTSTKSMMPEGLVSALRSIPEFLDLASYLFEINDGGPGRAAELRPSAEELVVKDDTKNLDHAGIWKRASKERGFDSGERIYAGLCVNCHGADGNKPSLPTARAFGVQKLKFGADPYRMFMTLSRGNGLMAATTHLSPEERYQVVNYIREEFMKGSNPDYEPVTNEYLESLPKGTDQGEFKPSGERDYGPALASQLGQEVTSALTVKLGGTTVSYNLHTLDQAGVWQGGFLDLNETQHQRGRGEGVAEPDGALIEELAGWAWGHDGSLDYPRDAAPARGPLPNRWLDYHGHYLHGSELVLSYAVDGREVLERPQEVPGKTAIRRTLGVEPGRPLVVSAGQGTGTFRKVIAGGTTAIVGERAGNSVGRFTAARVSGDVLGVKWSISTEGQLRLSIPEDEQPRTLDVVTLTGTGQAGLDALATLEHSGRDPRKMISGGDLRWPEQLSTVGYRGFEPGAYAVDTISIPKSTPWNTWFRTSALAFFPDGRMAVATLGGDVWVVSGVNDDLLDVKWKRFAGGMYEPLGMQVIDGLVYVTCKDRITRLHDLNNDGEADFYENFSADTDVSSFFHAFNFGLERDPDGNLYYAKCGQYTSHALPGSVIKVSPDGQDRSVYCTGFRTPNGLGMFPDGRLTVSDNQGNWMPASKVSVVEPGGFYGYVQTHSSRGRWAPDGGRIDHKEVEPPETFDPPMIWMPQDVDNSSGGQIWVDDPRWGPLSGRMLHTSFGKGWLFSLMMQEVDGRTQAALVRLPHNFNTGIMRGRVNPADGQVYVTGLDGWNNGGRPGLNDKGIQRVRYTGRPARLITDCQVLPTGLRLTTNFPLDPETAGDPESYEIEQWNYLWQSSYGSDMYHPETGEEGTQFIDVEEAIVSPDGLSVDLIIPNLRPVHQLRLEFEVKDVDGRPFEEEVWWTIHRVPAAE